MSTTPRPVRVMQIIFGLLAVQFLLPSLSYLFTPQLALAQAVTIGRLLGGGDFPLQGEQGYIFRVLASGNVFTLGVLCLLMLYDIQRFRALIPVFVVLKGYSAVAYLYVYLVELRYPLFLGIFFWDGLALFLVAYLGTRSLRVLAAR